MLLYIFACSLPVMTSCLQNVHPNFIKCMYLQVVIANGVLFVAFSHIAYWTFPYGKLLKLDIQVSTVGFSDPYVPDSYIKWMEPAQIML